jgi:MFS-type transporter involved in bile tolerance (Atg22 family)
LPATLYAKSELGIPTTNLMISFLPHPAHCNSGCGGDLPDYREKLEIFPAIMICVTIWSGLCYMGIQAPTGNANYFYVLASLVGFVMGGTQALSQVYLCQANAVNQDTHHFSAFLMCQKK